MATMKARRLQNDTFKILGGNNFPSILIKPLTLSFKNKGKQYHIKFMRTYYQCTIVIKAFEVKNVEMNLIKNLN